MEEQERIEYFSLYKYVSKIHLQDYVIEHIEETSQKFNEYLRRLFLYDKYAIIYFWIDSLYREFSSSNKIENHDDIACMLKNHDYFFDTLRMSRERVNDLHTLVMQDIDTSVPVGQYREGDVSLIGLEGGHPVTYYTAPPAEMVPPFMKEFIKAYNHRLSDEMENIFIKGALMHMLFIKIHPYGDGNGRTARIIHNMRFTESFNQAYGMKLKISPLNISQNVCVNRQTYVNRLNAVTFDGRTDDNQAINRWFDFVLNMIDEQLHFVGEKITRYHSTLENLPYDLTREEEREFLRKMERTKIRRPGKMY